MKIINQQMIFLATITMGAFLFWAFASYDARQLPASLLIQPLKNENDIVASKIMVTNQIDIVDVPLINLAKAQASMRLRIPKINVDANIDSMGVTEGGAMESPGSAKDVGWFSFGPRPGDVGNAVLAGHYGRWKNGDVSVFDNLHTLKVGDKIYVQDESGLTVTFVVRQLQTYDKNDDTSEVFISSDTASHLNIIACAGVYDEILKTYSNRLVVFTDKE